MRTLSLKIVERFPSELRALVAGQDRLTRPGVTAESDMAFDADLEELTSLIESAFGADDLDEQKVLDAIEEAVSIQRLRDERAARGAAGELRAEAICHGCYGDARSDVDRALAALDAAKRGRDQRAIDEARAVYCDALRAVGRFVAEGREVAR